MAMPQEVQACVAEFLQLAPEVAATDAVLSAMMARLDVADYRIEQTGAGGWAVVIERNVSRKRKRDAPTEPITCQIYAKKRAIRPVGEPPM